MYGPFCSPNAFHSKVEQGVSGNSPQSPRVKGSFFPMLSFCDEIRTVTARFIEKIWIIEAVFFFGYE